MRDLTPDPGPPDPGPRDPGPRMRTPHDKAYVGGVAIPDPDELLADINALDSWRRTVDERGKATAQKRKV